MPFWFKIALGWFCFLLITGTIRRLSMSKIKNAVSALDDEKSSRLARSYSLVITGYRVFFWLTPLYLFLVPCWTYASGVKHWEYFTAMILMMYLIVLEDFFFRKSILSGIKHG